MGRLGTGITRIGWLEAGQAILRKKGIEGVNLKALTGLLQVSRGSFYHHFEGFDLYLEDLANYFSGEHLERIFDLSEKRSGGDPKKQLLEIAAIIREDDGYKLMSAMRAWARHNKIAARSIKKLDKYSHQQLMKIFRKLGFSKDEAIIRAYYIHATSVSDLNPNDVEMDEKKHQLGVLDFFTRR